MDAGTVEGALIMKDLATAVIGRVDEALAKLEGHLSSAGAGAGKFAGGVDAAAERLSKIGSAVSDIGTTLSLGITAPLVAAAGVALKFSTDFEAAMTKVSTLSGIAAEEIGGLSDAVLAMAGDVAKSPQELAAALLSITSTGIKGAQALDILKKSAQAATVGLGDTKDVARAVVSAVTAYSKSGLDAARATEILFKAVKDGGAEASEFAGTLGRVVGVAAQVGVSFEEVTGFIASYSRLGVDAAEATTSLRATLVAILQETPQAKKALDSIGLSFKAVKEEIREKGLQATLQDLIVKFKGNDEALSALLGNSRALAGVLGTAAAQGKSASEIIAHLKQNTDELGDAFAQTQKTSAFTFQQLKAQAEATAIAFGNQLAPALKTVLANLQPLLDFVGRMVKAFAELPPSVQTSAIAVAAVFGAAGPIAFAIGKTITTIAEMQKALKAIGATQGAVAGIQGVSNAITGVGTASTVATVGVNLLRGAISGIVIFAVITYLEKVIEKINALGDEHEKLRKQIAENNSIGETAALIVGHQVESLETAKNVIAAYNAGLQGLQPTLEKGTKLSVDVAQAWEKGTQEAGKLGPAVTGMAIHLKGFGTAAEDAGASTTDYVAKLAAVNRELAALDPAQRAQIAAAFKVGESVENVAANLHHSSAAMEVYKKRLEDAASASQRAADEVKRLTEAFSGTKALNDLIVKLGVVKTVFGGDFSKLTRAQLQELQTDVKGVADRFDALGKQVPSDVDAAGKAIEKQLTTPIRNTIEWSNALGESLKSRIEQAAALAATQQNRVGVLLGDDKIKAAARETQVWALALAEATKRGRSLNIEFDQAATAAAVIDAGIEQMRANGEPIPEQWLEIVDLLHNASNSANDFAADINHVANATSTFGAKLKAALAGAFGGAQNFGKELTGVIVGALQGGGDVGKSIGATIGGKLGEGFGDAIGKTIGGKLGSFIGGALGPIGTLLGSLAGSGIGKLIGKIFGSDKKEGNKLRDQFVAAAGGLDELNKKAHDAGLSLDKLLHAKGTKEVNAAIKELQDGIAKADLEVGKLTDDLGKAAANGQIVGKKLWQSLLAHKDRDEVKKALADLFATSVDLTASGFNRIASNITGLFFPSGDDLDRLNKEIENAVKKGQPGKFAGEFLAGVQDQLTKIGPLAEAAFGALLAKGSSVVEAINALDPGLSRVNEILQATGLSATGFLGQIIGWQGIIDKNKELFEVLGGVGDMLTGLANSGLLTQESFDALAGIIKDSFTELTVQGVSGADALKLMQPQLQKLWEASQAWNLKLDEGTEALLAQAEASGLVGEKFKPAQEQMVDGINKLIGRLDALLTGLGIDLPREAATGAAGVENELGKIKIGPVHIPIRYDIPELPDGYRGGLGPTGPTNQPPLLAAGGVVSGRMHAIVGDAGPEAVIPLDRLEGWIRQANEGGGGYMLTADDIREGVLAALQSSGLAELGTSGGRADAVDKHVAPALPGGIARNQETRQRFLIALGLEG